MSPRRLGAWLLLLGAAGCRHYQERLSVPATLEVSAVVVYPFGFRWSEPAYRATELSQRLVAAALAQAGDQVLFFGPSEFRVYRPGDDVWSASNAVGLLPPYGLSVHKAVVLRPWAERRQATSQKEVLDVQGKPRGAKTVQETTYLGHVEVLYPSTREVLVEEVGQVDVDPFASHDDDPDPLPELTELMTGLARAALKALRPQLVAPARPVDLDLAYELNPLGDAFGVTDDGKSELDAQLSTLDVLEADVVRMTRVRYANPKLKDREVGELAKLPGGLYVTAAPKGAPLSAGDLIEQIDGRPALPQVLQRARFLTTPARLNVRHASGVLEEVRLF